MNKRNIAKTVLIIILLTTAVQTVNAASLDEALDNPGLKFTTSGAASWFGQNVVSYYGGDAAQSGVIGDSQSTYMETVVNGPGQIKFYWKTDSDAYHLPGDFLNFYIDGKKMARKGGNAGWEQQVFTVSPGIHTLRWSYEKDGGYPITSSKLDSVWVDWVEWQGESQSLTPLSVPTPMVEEPIASPSNTPITISTQITNPTNKSTTPTNKSPFSNFPYDLWPLWEFVKTNFIQIMMLVVAIIALLFGSGILRKRDEKKD